MSVLPVTRLSNSQIGMWLRCPKQWFYRYEKGLKIPPSGAMVQGSAYHGALKEYFDHKIKTNTDLSLNDTMDAFDTYWADSQKGVYGDRGEEDSKMEIDWESKDPGVLKDDAAVVVKKYHERIAPNIWPLRTEGYAEKMIGDVKYLGYLDLETPNEIVDHKLKSRNMPQGDADRDIQPLSYALLTGQKNFAFHVGVKKKIPEVNVVKVTKTDADILWWENAIIEVIRQMNTGIAPPNPTNWTCGPKYCGYYSICHK